MHKLIVQITKKPLGEDDFIHGGTIEDDGYDDFAYYIEDVEPDDFDKHIKAIESIFGDLFSVNGRELTYLGAGKFIADWKKAMRDAVDSFPSSDEFSFYNIERVLEYTHKQVIDRIYYGRSGDTYASEFGEFVNDVIRNNKAGDKFYIGGLVSFKSVLVP